MLMNSEKNYCKVESKGKKNWNVFYLFFYVIYSLQPHMTLYHTEIRLKHNEHVVILELYKQ